MKNIKIWRIIIAIALIIAIPLLLDWLVFGNEISSNISNEAWASFLGSYSGAILGGVFSLLGIILTIRFTQKENHEQRRIQVAPYLNISFEKTEQLKTYENELDYIFFSYEPNSTTPLNLFGVIRLKNVGFGPMLNCCISDVTFNNTPVPRPVPAITQNALEPKGEKTISIGLRAEDGVIDHSFLQKTPQDDMWEEMPVFDATKNKGGGRLSFYLCYNDIIGTPYQQKVSIGVQVAAKRSLDGVWKYVPSICLSEVGEREMKNEALEKRVVPFVIQMNSKKG